MQKRVKRVYILQSAIVFVRIVRMVVFYGLKSYYSSSYIGEQ
jgi:hypothetical protein